jgi:hypothetical protein
VYFFGGYQATKDDVLAWCASAKAQKPTVEFTVYPWPSGAGAGEKSAVAGFTDSGQYDKAVAAIKASKARTIYIVGHSSGCAIANAVDQGLADTGKVALVALDGFAPNPKQLSRESTQVWGAECDGVRSMNYPGPSGGRRKVYQAKACKKKWPLHFSLVNAAATDSTVKDPPYHLTTGYAGCVANLAWLP